MENAYLYGTSDATKEDFDKAKAALTKQKTKFTELFYGDSSQIMNVLIPIRSWFPGIEVPGFPFLIWDEDGSKKIAIGLDSIIKGKASEPVVKEIVPEDPKVK